MKFVHVIDNINMQFIHIIDTIDWDLWWMKLCVIDTNALC